jgi:hypothetical protein
MACTFSHYQYCGIHGCSSNSKESGTVLWHEQNTKIPKSICPNGYMDDPPLQTYDQGLYADRYMRRCKRKPTESDLKCASGQRTAIQCPNKYCRHSTPESISYMTDYCNKDNRIFDDPDCKKWGEYQASSFRSILKKKCTVGNIKRPQCQEFCHSNPGECPHVAEFCSLHSTDPICSCLNSSLNDVKFTKSAPVACVDNKCISTGYKTAGMQRIIDSGCPSIIDCSQIINAGEGAILDHVDIQQNCSIDINNHKNKKKTNNNNNSQENIKDKKKSSNELSDTLENISDNINSLIPDNININSLIPDSDFSIGEIEIDKIKPLVLLFIIIIFVTIYYKQVNADKKNIASRS